MSSNNQQTHGIRGLSIFIGDIRACQTKDQEIKVVHKEMAKIRQKFQNKGLSGYDKKKYVWKLIYAHILGYEVEFGHEEALNLINAQKFTEKSSGYIAIGIMLNEKSNFQLFERVMNAVKYDLNCGNEVCEGLALGTLGNIGFAEMVPELAPIVVEKVFAQGTNSYVRKRAIMCLLSFFRRNRSIYDQEKWLNGFQFLLEQKHKGILMSACSLISGVINVMGREGLYPLVPSLITVLATISSNAEDYYYYKTPCPWLQVKVLKLLQLFPPPEQKRDLNKINELMMRIMNNTEVSKNVNKNNSDHSILFEVFNLIIHYGDEAFEVLRHDTIKLMGQFVDVREPNIRYLALETMSRMANIDRKNQLIKRYIKVFFKNLRDKDISIRKIALNSLFGLCDQKMSGEVVNELLDYLQENNDYELKEEIVLKVAILAEKFAENLNWYIDVIIKLIEYAGDYVNEDLWFRVAQIITGFGNSEPNDQLQRYAALRLFDVLKTPSLHETMIRIGAYVLSEFGYLIADNKTYEEQFKTLDHHFYIASNPTKGIILTSYMKMMRNHPPLRNQIQAILQQYLDHWDEDLQQRACEYNMMIQRASEDPQVSDLIMNSLVKMPNFSSELQTNNVLTRRIFQLKVQKGFAINTEEAEKQMRQNMAKYNTSLSHGLNKNQGNAADDILGLGGNMQSFKTHQAAPQQQQQPEPMAAASDNDLLGMADPSPNTQPVKAEPLDNLAELEAVLGNMGQPSQPVEAQFDPTQIDSSQNTAMPSAPSTHPFKEKNPNSFAPNQTVQVSQSGLNMDCINANEWKGLLPTGLNQGVIYSSNEIEITLKRQRLKYLAQYNLTFSSKFQGVPHPSNIVAEVVNPEGDDKVTVKCSPAKYFDNSQPPQLNLLVLFGEGFEAVPSLNLTLSHPSPSDVVQLQIRLPIYLTGFVDSVDMPQDVFTNNWNAITFNQPDTFQKVDLILKNPAPHVDFAQVLEKIENFLSNAIGLKCYRHHDQITNKFVKLMAVGQVMTKPSNLQNIPSNPAEMAPEEKVPLMVQAEFFPDVQTDEFLLSLRAAPNKHVVSQVANMVRFFMNV